MRSVHYRGDSRREPEGTAALATPMRSVWSALASLAVLLGLSSCDGGGDGGGGAPGAGAGGRAALQQLEYGRLVDVYAYRRIDPARPDRRDILNRDVVLVQREVVVSPSIESESLFDAVGEENSAADYRFLPFDVNTGHDRLLILWDDTDPAERSLFDDALRQAQAGLVEVPASFRSQNTNTRPIPVVPRNAALVLTFSEDLGLSTAFFQANPGAIQVLEIQADPQTVPPFQAYRPLSRRVLARGRRIIVDTTIIGGETGGSGQFSSGLPPSENSVTANIRIAIPTGGVVAEQLQVAPDPVAELNGPDMNGDPAVIRDFRSGNDKDGSVGVLADDEGPMVVADLAMGVVAIDRANKILTINKRFAQVPIRGRIPFVVGGVVPATGLPGGPDDLPTAEPLRSGDIIWQDVVSPTGEVVRIRAEILQNEDVGNVIGEPGFPALGLARDGSDGASMSVARVRVATLDATDSQGNVVSFQASTLPRGADCSVRVHYYHHVPYTSGQAVVSDSSRVHEFLVLDPAPPRLDPQGNPVQPGTLVDPDATATLRFSEPMDLTSVQKFDNYVLTSDLLRPNANTTVASLLADPKPATLSLVTVDLLDQERNGTFLRLRPPMGLFHQSGMAERYWLHMLVRTGNPDDPVQDLGGNPVDVFDFNVANPLDTLSIDFSMDPQADENLVGSVVRRFASSDEDGTTPGSVDFFGQFQIGDGKLGGASVTRFSGNAEQQTLSAIQRWDKGECFDTGSGMNIPPTNGATSLYLCPSNVLGRNTSPSIPWMNQPVVFGGITEPLNPRGSRLQMTYREDDFALSYTDPSQMMIDIEQLHWAPWNNSQLQFDTFDRVTIRAGHSDWRPDEQYFLLPPPPPGMGPPTCELLCESLFSGLRTRFAQNPLQGSTMVPIVEDASYQVDPNSAFRAPSTTTYVPYPTFQQTYTWRDSRLVTWDRANDTAVGLAGAHLPNGIFPNVDQTAHVSSPWVPDSPAAGFPGTTWVLDEGDFLGNRTRDHDPIAMPLLLDFSVFPDNSQNGVARAPNEFHIAYFGPCWMPPPVGPGGYYNQAGIGCFTAAGTMGTGPFPFLRVHTSGGVTGTGGEVFVNPETTLQATGGWILDPGLGDPTFGRFAAPAGDDHLHWAQADFVRKVSMVTYGFLDTLKPNQHALKDDPNFIAWPGNQTEGGFPDFDALAQSRQVTLGVTDFLAVVNPPPQALATGTQALIEYRFADSFENSSLYDPLSDDAAATRGNMLNPSYACEAYRYAASMQGNRPDAMGLTPYVEETRLDTLRDSAGMLPRMMNFRIVFQNNVRSTPAVSPRLDSLAFVYRVEER